MIKRLPLVKHIYSASKQVRKALFVLIHSEFLVLLGFVYKQLERLRLSF